MQQRQGWVWGMGLAVLVTGAGGQPTTQAALEITLLLGSALEEFCN